MNPLTSDRISNRNSDKYTDKQTRFSGIKPLVLFALANIIMTAVAWSTNNFRQFLFNIDYIIPVLFLGVTQKWGAQKLRWLMASALLAIVMAVDLLTAFQQIYFTGPFVLLDMLPFVQLWPWRWIFPVTAAVLALAMLLVYFTNPMRGNSYRTRYVTAFVILLVLWDVSSHRLTNIVNFPARLNVTSSGLKSLGEPMFQHAVSRLSGDPVQFKRWKTRTLYSEILANDTRPGKILSVSVESFGAEVAPAQWNLLLRNIQTAMGPDYALVEARLQPYQGATLSGETRELCGLHFDTVPSNAQDLAVFDQCLPALLRKEGFLTSAWHGGDGWFYNRSNIYKHMGFEKLQFFGDMAPNVRRVCSYLFVAICDDDLLTVAVGSFQESKREFMHIMTIDSHLPISNRLIDCPPQTDRQKCLHHSMVEQTINSLGSAVRKSTIKPDLILVTGDHAPPFINGRVRREFRPGMVPWLIFVKRP